MIASRAPVTVGTAHPKYANVAVTKVPHKPMKRPASPAVHLVNPTDPDQGDRRRAYFCIVLSWLPDLSNIETLSDHGPALLPASTRARE